IGAEHGSEQQQTRLSLRCHLRQSRGCQDRLRGGGAAAPRRSDRALRCGLGHPRRRRQGAHQGNGKTDPARGGGGSGGGRPGGGRAAVAGAGAAAVTGAFSPPFLLAGAALGALDGAAIAHLRDGLPHKDLKELGKTLNDGTAAVVVVAESTVQEAMQKVVKRA